MTLPAMTASAPRRIEPRPTTVSPMMRQARPMTTMPVPPLMSALFWAWPTTAPDRAVRELEMHRPTVTVKVGLMEEARTISRLSPVARMLRPSRVPRKLTSRAPISRVIPAARTVSYQSPPRPVARNRENTVSCLSRLTLDFHPIAIRLTV